MYVCPAWLVAVRSAPVICVALLPPHGENFVRHETTLGVVDVVLVIVTVEDGELCAVDRAELVCGDTEHQGHERIDLDEGLSSILSDPEQGVRRSTLC